MYDSRIKREHLIITGTSQVAFCRITQLKSLVLKLSNGEASVPQDVKPLIEAITIAIQRLMALLKRIREVSHSHNVTAIDINGFPQ